MSFLRTWAEKVKKYLFTYRDGFFIFPIFTADPEQLIEGFKNTPMVKFDPVLSYANTRNLFFNGDTYIRQLEEGLWIIYASMVYKKNLCYEMVYNPEIPNNYYTLAIDTSKTAKESTHYSTEGRYIENESYFWRLIKPGTIAANYNLANTSSRIISLYIHEDWFNKYFFEHVHAESYITEWFDDPDKTEIFLPNSSIVNPEPLEAMFYQFENQDKQELDLLVLKSNAYLLLSAFARELTGSKNIYSALKPKDEAKVLKAELLLKASMTTGFPTIHKLAKKVGLSETKLKADFKSMYGKTLFQYFTEIQMDVAEKMLLEGHHSIKSIAFTLGYSHPGKFSSAFKKIKNIAPSSVRNHHSSQD